MTMPGWLTEALHQSQACRWGVARAEPVDADAQRLFDQWLSTGRHASMAYMERYPQVRSDPRLLLEAAPARSIIVAAFSYYNPVDANPLGWPLYALGRDYHETVRSRLEAVAGQIETHTGSKCRVCVDTAPLRERYWARRAGVGRIGRNGLLIVPGVGSYVVIGAIITSLELPPSEPLGGDCGRCDRCVEQCPGRALDGHGGVDARRCLSYLTIECRDQEIDPPTADGRLTAIYGCDICQRVCPHNRLPSITAVADFTPRREILALTRADVASMTQERFSAIFAHSAIKRVKLAGLKRNLRYLR